MQNTIDRTELLDSLTDRERMAIAVDLVAHISGGPLHTDMHKQHDSANQAERVVLMTLDVAADRGECMTMSELAKWVGLSRAAVTSLADRLSTAGVIARIADPDDRRSTLLSITDAGRTLVAAALEHDADASVAA